MDGEPGRRAVCLVEGDLSGYLEAQEWHATRLYFVGPVDAPGRSDHAVGQRSGDIAS